MPIGDQLLLFAPMIALVVTMLGVVICPVVVGRRTGPVAAVASIGVIITFFFALRLIPVVADGGFGGLTTAPQSGLLLVDNLSVIFQILLLVFMAGVIALWWMGSAAAERDAPEFFILLLGSALGMVLMVSTANLLVIVMAIELASLPSYAFVGFDKRDPKAAEASLKYMIFGAVCAAIMLYGASLLYGCAGSLNVADIAATIADGEIGILPGVGLLCFFVGLAFKISAVPFHFWCPDAFEGAKIEVTTWLSVASKAAGLILLIRLVMVFCQAVDSPSMLHGLWPIAWVIGLVAALTCTVGNFSAYKQRSVKRLLAYSSIAHAGYMMMAAAVLVHPSQHGFGEATSALLMYIIIYLFMNLGAFGVTAMVVLKTGSDDIDAFTGLIRRAPGLAIPMVICLVSLVGIPPFAGFIGKWWLLLALGDYAQQAQMGLNPGRILGWVLVIVIVVNTLISLFYYMRIVVKMTLEDDDRPALRAPVGGVALANLCAVMLLLLFVFAQPLKTMADRFSRSLFQPQARSARLDRTPAAALPASGSDDYARRD